MVGSRGKIWNEYLFYGIKKKNAKTWSSFYVSNNLLHFLFMTSFPLIFGFFRFDLSRNELVSQVCKIFQIWRTDFLIKPCVFWIICLFVCFLVCFFLLSSLFLFLVKGKRCSREYTWGPHFGDARVIICVSKRNHSHKSSTDRSKAFLVFVLFVLD